MHFKKTINQRHLISINDLDLNCIDRIFNITSKYSVNYLPDNYLIANIFCEPSTRTRLSFEIAAKQLSANVINLDPTTSSIIKGESVIDTAKTLESLGIKMIIIRHSESGMPAKLALSSNIPIINAGDGTNEHPTQALIDAYVIKQ